MSQVFTPTVASAGIAGFTFSALVWAILLDIDTILGIFGFGHLNYAKRWRRWINDNKRSALCITELINFSIHGITDASAVTFAIGSTICNLFFILFINPFLCRRDRKRSPLLVYNRVKGAI